MNKTNSHKVEESKQRYWRWWILVWYKHPDSYPIEIRRFIGRFFNNIRDMWPYARRSNVFLYYFNREYRYKAHMRLKSKRYGSGFKSGLHKAKKRVALRDGVKCNICKQYFIFERLTLDHVIPISRGGVNDDENLQLLCVPCHTEKTKEENRTAPPRKAGAIFSEARPPHRRVRRMVSTKSKIRQHRRVRDMGRTRVAQRQYASNSVDYPGEYASTLKEDS